MTAIPCVILLVMFRVPVRRLQEGRLPLGYRWGTESPAGSRNARVAAYLALKSFTHRRGFLRFASWRPVQLKRIYVDNSVAGHDNRPTIFAWLLIDFVAWMCILPSRRP